MGARASLKTGRSVRAAGRRHGAGAAMVEAVVVLPTFIILFTASIFIWQLYVQKMKVMADSRYKLWSYAISDNCGDTGDPGVGGAAPAISLTGSASTAQASNGLDGTGFAGDTGQGYGAVQNGDSTGTLQKSLGSVTYEEHGKNVQAASVLGGFQATTSARRSMLCNEPPHNGTLFGLAKAAVHSLTSW